MQLNKQIFKVITTVSLALPSLAAAQNLTSSINTFSPYSMYGLGELATPGTTSMRSMGGVGVAMRSTNKVNVLNPAAYSQTPQKSFLFEFGVEAGHFRNSQTKYGTPQTTARTAYNSINFHEIAFQMPLAKGLGFGFSLTPYSNVGYNMHSDELSSGVAGNLGRAQYQYYGDGDVTEAKAGIGWSPFKNFSIGAAMQYYWGNITRNYKAVPTDIITGSGEKAFVAGADIGEMSTLTKAEGEAFGKKGNDVFRKLETFPIPVIAAVNGFALGGGCEISMSCDIRICSENAVFGQPEVGLGITPGFGGTQRLARIVGTGKAKEMIYGARNIKAEEAYRIGLVNNVYPAEELMPAAKKLASTIARNAPIAVRNCKRAINEGIQVDMDQAIVIEEKLFGSCFETCDQKEGMNAFLEKRKVDAFLNK